MWPQALALGMDAPGIEGKSFLLTDEPLLSAREYVAETAKATGSAIDAERRRSGASTRSMH